MNQVQDQKTSIEKGDINALSFFSGAMGLDLGLEKEGITTLLACENNKAARATILKNHPKIGLIGDICQYSMDEILAASNCNREDIDVIVGGPPCQAFSTAGRRKGFDDERGNVFLNYLDVIDNVLPRYVVIENVRGMYSSKINTPIPSDPFSSEFEKSIPGSVLYYVLHRLRVAGYSVNFNLYNSANFGVPQLRERVVIVGKLGNNPLPFLYPTHEENAKHNLPPWITIHQAFVDLPDSCDYISINKKRIEYLSMLKPGENWRNLPQEVQKQAMGKAYELAGGKTGFYRRVAWNRPSPTLVTHPAMPATELAHPTLPRPLSIQEYKRIQQFPDNYEICGNLIDQYKQIGNAVPVGLGRAIGRLICNDVKGISEMPPTHFRFSRYTNTSCKDFEETFKKSMHQKSQQLSLF